MTVCRRQHDGGRPGDGERTAVPALHPVRVPGVRVPRGPAGAHRHADHVHPHDRPVQDKGMFHSFTTTVSTILGYFRGDIDFVTQIG